MKKQVPLRLEENDYKLTPDLLRENMDENIFNMIDAENYSFRDGSNFFVQANFNPQYKDRAISLVKQELEKLKETLNAK